MGFDGAKYVAPADAAEFFAQCNDFVVNLARKQLGASGNGHDAEDVAADIMAKMVEKSVWLMYDPEFVSERTGTSVTWKSFLAAQVTLRMRGKREQVSRHHGREMLLCDAPAGDGAQRWVELFGGQVWDDYPSLSDSEFYERLRNYLATRPEDWGGPCSLYEVFSEVLERAKAGEPARPAIQRRFGMSRKDADVALHRMGVVVKEAMEAPPVREFSVCGVVLSASEVREAITLLRAGRGNHVHRPLATHRIQLEAAKGWYHSIARSESKLFPEIKIDPQTHRQPADHVKRAVIHFFERLLREAMLPPEPEPETEITKTEILESELWHITGLKSEQVDQILNAVQRVYAAA